MPGAGAVHLISGAPMATNRAIFAPEVHFGVAVLAGRGEHRLGLGLMGLVVSRSWRTFGAAQSPGGLTQPTGGGNREGGRGPDWSPAVAPPVRAAAGHGPKERPNPMTETESTAIPMPQPSVGGFDPIGDRLRASIAALFEKELAAYPGRIRQGRGGGARKGYRHGPRAICSAPSPRRPGACPAPA